MCILRAIVLLFLICSIAHAGSVPTLTSPLQGNFLSRYVTSSFGDDWNNTWWCSYIKKHTGIDVYAQVGENVYAAYDGYVRRAKLDSTNGGYVSIDHGPAHTFNLVTTYWHILPSVSENTWVVVGQKIGTIADLGDDTHFHFSTYEGGYTNPTSYAGSLPQVSCNGYPPFPSAFKNPTIYTYYNHN